MAPALVPALALAMLVTMTSLRLTPGPWMKHIKRLGIQIPGGLYPMPILDPDPDADYKESLFL